jgi:HSP20 family protein
MAVRDLIPWGRQESRAPALFRDEERSPFHSLRREMDRLFDDFFSAPVTGFGRAASIWPSLEVSETHDEVKVTAELPGLAEKDVELTVEDGLLTLRGEKKGSHEERGWSERFYGRFERSIALPSGVEEEKAQAEFRDGVLTVTLPRSGEEVRGRRIPINTGTRH